MYVFLILMDGLLAIASPQKKGATKDLPLLWRQPYYNNLFTGAHILHVGAEGVLISQHTDLDQSEKLCMLDADTGTLRWTWSDYFAHPTILLRMSRQQQAVQFPYFFFATGKGNYTIHLQTGKTIMKNTQPFSCTFNKIGNSVLCVQNHHADSIAQIALVDMVSGAQTLIYETNTPANLSAELDCPAFALEKNGDTLLYWRLRMDQIAENLQETTLFAYNLTQKRLLYQRVFPGTEATTYAPLVCEDLVIIEGQRAIFAFQRQTGKQAWQLATQGQDWQQLQILDGYLVTTDATNGNILALDPKSGALVWEINLAGPCSLPQALEGIIYTVNQKNGLLYAIRLCDGKVLWEMESPDLQISPYSGFSFGIGIDPVHRRLYVSSFLAAYCFQLAQP